MPRLLGAGPSRRQRVGILRAVPQRLLFTYGMNLSRRQPAGDLLPPPITHGWTDGGRRGTARRVCATRREASRSQRLLPTPQASGMEYAIAGERSASRTAHERWLNGWPDALAWNLLLDCLSVSASLTSKS